MNRNKQFEKWFEGISTKLIKSKQKDHERRRNLEFDNQLSKYNAIHEIFIMGTNQETNPRDEINTQWLNTYESYWGVLCGANLWFGGFPYPVNPGRPEWSKVQTRGKPLVATAQAKYVSAGE